MKLSRFQLGLAIGLLALLAALAGLQVVWLGRISEAEKDRMTRRLQSDSQRFTEDFNRELSTLYTSFQTESSIWQSQNWKAFADRDAFWRERAAYPDLIRRFYYVPANDDSPILLYDRASGTFVGAEETDDLRALTAGLRGAGPAQSVDAEHAALRIVQFDGNETVNRIVVEKRVPGSSALTKLDLPTKIGVLVIALDEAVIRERVLPDLVAKHFPDGDYRVAVTTGEKIIWGTPAEVPDHQASLFGLVPENMLFLAGRDGAAPPSVKMSGVIVNQTSTIRRFETRTIQDPLSGEKPTNTRIEVHTTAGPPGIPRTSLASAAPSWQLSVTHVSGSVDSFINSTKWRNLGITFGILALLATCVLMIFVSTQRARLFAQRQVDFVSSVSHEFRTPLAVIFSAGENLADGVAAERSQVERYGHLIKNEGRKLSQMVEQILEFAGANSGRRNLSLDLVSAAALMEDALAESATLLEENGFVVEKEVDSDGTLVKADFGSFSRALQNLIANAVKYSNGSRVLKVALATDSKGAEFSIEDHGFGIDRSDISKIFEPFFRAKSVVDRQISGNGLGLSLVRETVRAHGGDVTVESEPGRGSVFTVRIPTAGRDSL